MLKFRSCALVLLLAGLVGCGGADDDATPAAPAAAEPVRESAPAAREPAAAPVSAPVAQHSTSSEPQTTVPDVELMHRKQVEEAWEKALAGSDPTTACAIVKSQAAAAGAEAAARAVAACSVDIPVRYFHTQLAQVASGSRSCEQVMLSMQSQLPALTMSLASVRELTGSDKDDSDASSNPNDAAAADAPQLVKERLYDAVVATCPAQAADMLQ